MAKLRLYPQGTTGYIPSPGNSAPVLKTVVSGWSRNSVRSLIRCLYSIDIQALLPGNTLIAFTLTLRNAPSTPDDWKSLTQALSRWCFHRDAKCLLWLTEWQSRGVPHLHGFIVWPVADTYPDFLNHWVRLCITRGYGAELTAQHASFMDSPVGWCEYLAKHSARGLAHYQRCNSNIPSEWRGKTGRMWGVRGKVPRRDPIELSLDDRTFFRWRRSIRSRAISLARGRRDPKSITYARTMLKHSDPKVSRVRGLSVFADLETSLGILTTLQGRIEQ